METKAVPIFKSYQLYLVIVLLASLCVTLPVFAHGGEDHTGIPWPPQPPGITNVIVHSDAELEKAPQSLAASRTQSLEQQAINDPNVNRSLGKKYKRMTLITPDKNQTNDVSNELIFFSYDKNATVKVKFANYVVKSVQSTAAKDYQPEITDEEATEAEALARTYFINKGVAQVANLEAFSILAYKPEGSGFYDTRVIYVSFHDNEDSPPEFMAWVDLSKQQVIKTREEK